MSQETKAGSNAPGLAVRSGEPEGVAPKTRTAPATPTCFPAARRRSITGCVASSFEPSPAVGVGHNAAPTCSDSGRLSRACVSALASGDLWSRAVGVAQRAATSFKFAMPCPCAFFSATYSGLCAGKPSRACGVGHKPEPFPPVRGADTASRQIAGPAGISQRFQVSAYPGEPLPPILARNLFSKDDWRAALGDEVVKSGPEVSFVGMALPLSRARKRLTGTGAGPQGGVVEPAGKPGCVGPPAEAGEEVALHVAL